jgi:hypothetical protein
MIGFISTLVTILSRAEGQLALVSDVMAFVIPGFHLTPIC